MHILGNKWLNFFDASDINTDDRLLRRTLQGSVRCSSVGFFHIFHSIKIRDQMILRRIKAFAIDYLIILLYIGLLFGTTLLISDVFTIKLKTVSTATAELTGFFTLTLPVILYFSFTEAGKHHSSVGKRKMNLKVVSKNAGTATFIQLLIRNCIKFLPWELAHFFIYQLFHYSKHEIEPPARVLAGLIIAQSIVVIYFLFIFFTKNNRSIYEIASGTRVIYEK